MGVHFQNRLNHIIDVALSIDSSRYRQPNQLVLGVFSEHHRPDLHRPYAGMAVQLDRERLPGKLVPRDVRQQSSRVDIDGVATRRLDNRDPVVGNVAP